jgi:hypothetical protein
VTKPGLLFDLKNISEATNRVSPRLKPRSEPSRSHIPIGCTCRITFSKRYRYWTSLNLLVDKIEEHWPSCRYYRCRRKIWTLGMRVLLPQILLKAIRFSFSIKSGAGGFALSTGLASSRIINRLESPPFILFQTASKDLERAVGFQPPYDFFSFSQGFSPFDWSECAAVEAEDILNNLIHDIDFHIATGEASAQDQDENGKTLLHVSTSQFDIISL